MLNMYVRNSMIHALCSTVLLYRGICALQIECSHARGLPINHHSQARSSYLKQNNHPSISHPNTAPTKPTSTPILPASLNSRSRPTILTERSWSGRVRVRAPYPLCFALCAVHACMHTCIQVCMSDFRHWNCNVFSRD